MWSPRTRGWSPASRSEPVRPGGPRARGGGPTFRLNETGSPGWSPRTRGWSPVRVLRRRGHGVVPAHAGVVPSPGGASGFGTCGPRARGGGPGLCGGTDASPAVVPAHAGVVPASAATFIAVVCGPRARGGGPRPPLPRGGGGLWSPRTRGWSRHRVRDGRRAVVVPAHAGVVPRWPRRGRRGTRGPRARGGGPRCTYTSRHSSKWSPRTRGWSLERPARDRLRGVVPAHAGVVPSRPCPPPPAGSGPRARGGGPPHVGPPRCDGGRGPRARGGGPPGRAPTAHRTEWSPRTRGWSRARGMDSACRGVVPAHAGVVPSSVVA